MKTNLTIAALAACGALAAAHSISASQTTTPTAQTADAQAAKSVWDGVYTDEQAKRGAAVYRQWCASCHGNEAEGGEMAPGLTGGGFTSNWKLACLDVRMTSTGPTRKGIKASDLAALTQLPDRVEVRFHRVQRPRVTQRNQQFGARHRNGLDRSGSHINIGLVQVEDGRDLADLMGRPECRRALLERNAKTAVIVLAIDEEHTGDGLHSKGRA